MGKFTFEIETVVSYGNGKRKAEDPLDSDTLPKKNKGGRPRGVVSTPPPRKAPTKLRVDRPVQARIPMDIWQNVLSFCNLDFLLKLRTTCPSFYQACRSELVWKRVRHRQFGLEHPDPPAGITELQYADLLTGVGCQTHGCEGKARRTYWAFRRRWCEICVTRKTIRGRDAMDSLPTVTINAAYKCIPQAKFDSWGHYQWVRDASEPAPWMRAHGAQSIAFAEVDLERFVDMYKLKEEENSDKLEVWLAEKTETNEQWVAQLQVVEQWAETHRLDRLSDLAEAREARAKFFKQHARLMNPPMSEDLLHRCPSYHRAIAISRPVSKRSWDSLRPKLVQEYQAAQVKLDNAKRKTELSEYRRELRKDYAENVEKRFYYRTPEQELVLSLADQVIRDEVGTPKVQIDDSDLVNIILRGVYKAYEGINISLRPVTRHGPYRLLMDDAKMIYQKKILPMFKACFDDIRLNQAVALQCPACTAAHSGKFTFTDLMDHIFRQHRYQHPDFAYMEPVDQCRASFPWLCHEWPRNLPMLAVHQKSTGRWNIDDDAPYVRADPTRNVPNDPQPREPPVLFNPAPAIW